MQEKQITIVLGMLSFLGTIALLRGSAPPSLPFG